MFIMRCVQSDSDDLLKFVSNHAVFHGYMNSGLGRNFTAFSQNCNLSLSFLIL